MNLGPTPTGFLRSLLPAGNAGFRYWKPVTHILKPVWEVPGYSEEQYRIPLNKWVRYAQKRLALSQETDPQMMTRLLKTTCEGFTARVTSIKEGLDYLKSNNRCMDYATYDTYSTPNRDRRVFDDFSGFASRVSRAFDNQWSKSIRPLFDRAIE